MLATVLLIGIVSEVSRRYTFKPLLLPGDEGRGGISAEQLKLAHREPANVVGIKNPVSHNPGSPLSYPPTPLAEVVQKVEERRERVSLILIQEHGKLAIVDGIMVHEGERIGNEKVIRIEKNRVLLRNGSREEWLSVTPQTPTQGKPSEKG